MVFDVDLAREKARSCIGDAFLDYEAFAAKASPIFQQMGWTWSLPARNNSSSFEDRIPVQTEIALQVSGLLFALHKEVLAKSWQGQPCSLSSGRINVALHGNYESGKPSYCVTISLVCFEMSFGG